MKKLITVIFLSTIALLAFSQEEELDHMIDKFLFGNKLSDSLFLASGIDDSDIAEFIKLYSGKSQISLRTDFENKTYFAGQDLGIDQFNISSQVYYMGSKGLIAGISGIMYSKFDPKYNTTIATLGYYSNILNSNALSVRTLYSRYFFAKVDSIETESFNNSGSLGFSWTGAYAGASADAVMLFGNNLSGQVNTSVWGHIPVARFGLSNKLTIDPELSLLFGNETIFVSQYLKYQSKFGLRNTSVRLPLTFSSGRFDISAGYNFNFPRIPGSSIEISNTHYFNISLGYVFML
jgi:hypothetical protein